MKRPFIIKELSKFNPDGVYGVANQPNHTLLFATEEVAGKQEVVEMKITDGITAYKDLKNLLTGEIPSLSLQSVMEEGNTSDIAMYITGQNDITPLKDGLLLIKNGIAYLNPTDHPTRPNRWALSTLTENSVEVGVSLSIGNENNVGLILKPQDENQAGIVTGALGNATTRIALADAINENEAVTLRQLQESSSNIQSGNGVQIENEQANLGGQLTEPVTLAFYDDVLGGQTSLNLYNENIEITTSTSTGPNENVYSRIQATPTEIKVIKETSLTGDEPTPTGLILTDFSAQFLDQTNSKGLEYYDDYSANFTDRSLVDKAFVVDSIALESQNLLHKTGNENKDGYLRFRNPGGVGDNYNQINSSSMFITNGAPTATRLTTTIGANSIQLTRGASNTNVVLMIDDPDVFLVGAASLRIPHLPTNSTNYIALRSDIEAATGNLLHKSGDETKDGSLNITNNHSLKVEGSNISTYTEITGNGVTSRSNLGGTLNLTQVNSQGIIFKNLGAKEFLLQSKPNVPSSGGMVVIDLPATDGTLALKSEIPTDYIKISPSTAQTAGINITGNILSGGLIRSGTEVGASSTIGETKIEPTGISFRSPSSSSFSNIIRGTVATANRLQTLQDKDGVIALLSDINDIIGNYQALSEKGQANGYASLDENGKITINQIPDTLLGALKWGGTYDGTTITASSAFSELNGQPLPDPADYEGVFFVSTGNYTQSGIDFLTGDWIIAINDSWGKVANTDAVTSVNGQIGNVSLGLLNINDTDWTTLYNNDFVKWDSVRGKFTNNQLAQVALTNDYNDLNNKPAPVDLNFATGMYVNSTTGVYEFFKKGSTQSGYLPANGAILNIATYPDLYTKLGTRYGGNGVTTFGLPDYSSVNWGLAMKADIPALVDISGKANLDGGNTFTGDQTINGGNLTIEHDEAEFKVISNDADPNQYHTTIGVGGITLGGGLIDSPASLSLASTFLDFYSSNTNARIKPHPSGTNATINLPALSDNPTVTLATEEWTSSNYISKTLNEQKTGNLAIVNGAIGINYQADKIAVSNDGVGIANGEILFPTITTNIQWTFPNATGTLALKSEVDTKASIVTPNQFQGEQEFNDGINVYGNAVIQERIRFIGDNGVNFANLIAGNVATDRNFTFPNASGILATQEWVTANTGASPLIVTGNNSLRDNRTDSPADNSILLGVNAGKGSTSGSVVFFAGYSAGNNSPSTVFSNFIGYYAGTTSQSSNSNFIGYNAGKNSIAGFSNFIGDNAGNGATGSNSNMIGNNAGNGATNAPYSNFIGNRTGLAFSGNNVGSNNIIIGNNISLPNATTNSINIGGVLFGSGTNATVTGNPKIVPNNGKIGINKVVPTSALDVVGLLEYADNAAALAAGLTDGAFYRTGDLLKVVHN